MATPRNLQDYIALAFVLAAITIYTVLAARRYARNRRTTEKPPESPYAYTPQADTGKPSIVIVGHMIFFFDFSARSTPQASDILRDKSYQRLPNSHTQALNTSGERYSAFRFFTAEHPQK